MAQICDITGKTKQHGHHVSFSQRKTQKIWRPNLQTRRIVLNGKKVKLLVSAQGIRLLKKRGLL